ncbi:fumarylacetoacetate hydrolase family protein [Streptomyces sp. NPDC054883]
MCRARDQRRSGQRFFSKGQDSHAPFGPVVVTADEVPDPVDLDLSLRLNGVTKQKSNTRNMLFRTRCCAPWTSRPSPPAPATCSRGPMPDRPGPEGAPIRSRPRTTEGDHVGQPFQGPAR